jgi:hypothetical protein
MGLLSAPDVGVSIRAPVEVRPGERLGVTVEVDQPEGVEVGALELVLEGTESATIVVGNEDDYRAKKISLVHDSVKLRPHSQTRWVSRHTAAFDLAPGLPPSFDGVNAGTHYRLVVRADNFKEALAVADVHVAPPPRADAPAGAPVQQRSGPTDPASRAPILELSLATNVVSPGDVVAGAFALANLGGWRFSGVDLWLVQRETARTDMFTHPSEGHHHPRLATFPVPAEGETVPFEVIIPRGLFPSWTSKLWTFEWLFELRATRLHDAVLRVPITVLPPTPPATRRPPRRVGAAPAVGSARVQALWTETGAKEGLALDESGALLGEIAETSIVVRRQHRGRAGLFLVSELRYPALHLDLMIRKEGALAALLGRGHRIGDRKWDRRYLLLGREAAQITALLRGSLFEALRHAGLTSMDDVALRVEEPGSGETAAELAPFVGRIAAIARALASARSRIPPPAAMSSALEAWKRLAETLGGPLETARMAVAGRRGGLEASVATEWSRGGEPLHTALTLRPGWPIAAQNVTRLAPGQPPPEAWPPPAAALLPAAFGGADALEVREDVATLALPAPVAELPVVLDRLDGLAALCAALREGVGPYR